MNKKILCMIALSALTLASCSKDQSIEQPKQNAIAFNVLSNPVTRAEATTKDNLGNFKVTAFDDTKDINFFEDQVVNKKGEMDNKYYWPSTGTLKFYAYAPTDAPNVTINKDGQTIADFTPKVPVDQQQDLIVAYNQGNAKNNENQCLPLNFRHALSQIVIQAKNISDDIKVEVIGVKISQVKNKGTLTIPELATPENSGNLIPFGNWAIGNDVQRAYSITGETGEKVTLNKKVKNIMFNKGGMMLLPQQTAPWKGNDKTVGSYISVLCRISSKDGNYVYYPKDPTKYAYSAVPVAATWEPGKKYVYTLIFGDSFGGKTGGGQVDPDNIDPNNPTSDIIDDDPTTKKGGEEILGAPICFEVTVDNWVDGPNIPNIRM